MHNQQGIIRKKIDETVFSKNILKSNLTHYQRLWKTKVSGIITIYFYFKNNCIYIYIKLENIQRINKKLISIGKKLTWK